MNEPGFFETPVTAITTATDKVNKDQPFHLFRSQGEYCIIQPKLPDVNVNELLILVNWQTMPANITDYYKGYEHEFNNGIFKISISIFDGVQWQLIKPAAELLQQTNEYYPVSKASFFSMPVRKEWFVATNEMNTPDNNNSIPFKGAIRIELVAPSYAFGHSLYANVVSAAALKNAKGESTPIPNPPFNPLVSSLHVYYRSSEWLLKNNPELLNGLQ